MSKDKEKTTLIRKLRIERRLLETLWKQMTTLFAWKEFYNHMERLDGTKLFNHEKYPQTTKLLPQITKLQDDHTSCRIRIKEYQSQLEKL